MTERVSASAGSPDLTALAAITDAVEAGAGLPEILRAAARALDASPALIDRGATVLAVAARSPADERSLLRGGEDVASIDLKVADATVGTLRMRARGAPPDGSLLRLLTTLIASEMERTRAPERASERAAVGFQQAALAGQIGDREDLVARGREFGIDLASGATVVVVRAHPRKATEDDWRTRLLALALRGARSVAPGSSGSPTVDRPGEVVILISDPGGATGPRCSAAIMRELEAG